MIGDIFDLKSVSPMLLNEKEPFDSKDYIYELKLDGVRAVAYLDKNETDIRNKRNKILKDIYPELQNLHHFAKKKCIIDGEIIVLKDGKPDFYEIQRRSLMTDRFKIELSAKTRPVRFVAYDIVYLDDEEITQKPLLERKEILTENIDENEELALSRYIFEKGIDFFKLTEQENLEGVVAKKKDSRYYFGIRSKDWFKFKNLLDSEFVICGLVLEEDGSLRSIALGAYYEGKLLNQGHVSLGIPKEEARLIMQFGNTHKATCPYDDSTGDQVTIWIEPRLVCTVQFMMRTKSLTLRQPVYKGLRMDKTPEECIINQK